jgi:hypothetical protein
MLNSEIANPEPIRDKRIAMTPTTSAPKPGEDIPKIRAKMPKMRSNEVRIGLEINSRI